MIRSMLALAALLAASAASAADLSQGKLFLNGFGSAGWGRTGANVYRFATSEGGYQARFSLSAISRAYDDVVLGAQFELTDAGTIALDWAFAEWRLSDQLRLRAGQSKHPFGLYAETADVGTTRPFYTLPAAVYGPVGIVAEAYIGLGAGGGVRGAGGWGLDYDVYGGQLEFEMLELDAQLATSATPGPVMSAIGHLKDLFGGRVVLHTPIRGLGVRLSAYRARHHEEVAGGMERTQVVVGPAVEFLTDQTSVRAEYYHLALGEETAEAAYLEVAQFLGEHVQVAARGEILAAKLEGMSSSPYLRHREGALGVNYWVNPDLVFKASFHLIDGNRFALPAVVGPSVSPRERTRVVFAGSQFSF